MRQRRAFLSLITVLVMSASVLVEPAIAPVFAATSAEAPASETFAVIGDYGTGDSHEADIARMVGSWDPDYILTTGDNYQGDDVGTGTAQYDERVGAYYGPWLKDITTTGTRFPVGLAPVNAFFPCLGNHDYDYTAEPTAAGYLTYFDLPGADFASSSGNERYYDFVRGPVHFFVVNSNADEPDGVSSTSKQARWLETQLRASDSKWNVVYEHEPPYSSDTEHGSTAYMRWPFAEWGADAVLSGHAHAYERIMRDGIVYLVDGLGGAPRYDFGTPVDGSTVRYRADWGAIKGTVSDTALTFSFYNAAGDLVDTYRLPAPAPPAGPSGLSASAVSTSQVSLTWTDNADDETGFKVERSADGKTWTQIATLGPDAERFAATVGAAGSATAVSQRGDGQVYTAGQDWGSVRAAASGTTYYTGDIEVGSRLKDGSYSCSRGFLAFDLSGMPADATVRSAYLTLTREGSSLGAPGIFACPASQASASSLAPGDYDAVGATALTGQIAFAAGNTPTRVDLNAAGVAYLSSAGPRKYIALRHATDLADIAPTGSNRTWLWASEASTAAYRPTLTVTWGGDGALTDSYRVRAYNAQGDSAYSNVASATSVPPAR